MLERGQKPIMNVIQPETHPLEILHDVKKLIQVQNVCQQKLFPAFL